MKITNYIPPVKFQSNNRIVVDNPAFLKNNPRGDNLDARGHKKLLYANTTSFFRDDLEEFGSGWIDFREAIVKAFENAPKVNVYDFAASDGSEAYSLIISLIEALGVCEAQKYFPIKAFDIDCEAVKKAKSGEILGGVGDMDALCCNTGGNVFRYFNIKNGPNPFTCAHYFYPKDDIKNLVDFNEADIVDEIDNIEPDNSLVLCRNFWPYLNKDTAEKTFARLCEHLGDKSVIVIGSFDKRIWGELSKSLAENGFKQIFQNTYQKDSAMIGKKYSIYK